MGEDARVDEMYRRVGSLAEVPEGELRSFDLPGLRVAIAHVENDLYVFGDECTHEGCSLAEGKLGDQEDTVSVPATRASSTSRRASPSGARRSIRCRCTPSE